jgi:ADP-ribose pyrophosphatase YjhB (NUDIX family)
MIDVAAAIIIQDKELLLVKQKNRDYWTPPGGLVDEGETPAAACVRETREEIGVEVEILAPLKVQRRWWPQRHDFLKVYNFLATIKNGRPHCVNNHDCGDVEKIAWVGPSDFESCGVPSGTDEVFEEGLRFL